MGRVSTVAAGGEGFAGRYLRSFGPSFLLAPAAEPALHRLRSVGLVHVFEAALALAGIAACVARRERRALLPVLLVLAAPLAFALHRDAPDPILAVVMLPWLQALGGIGGAWLAVRAAALAPPARVALAAGALVWAAFSVGRMSDDLYRRFPVYAAATWSYGVRDAVRALEARRAPHDVVLVDVGEKLIGSLILFYTRLDPRVRHAEVGGLEGRSERTRAGAYRIGPLDETTLGPGPHLVWTTPVQGARLARARDAQAIARVPLPDGGGRYVLLSVSIPR
jgi:hypothetical protein